MKKRLTKKELVRFGKDIGRLYESAKIRAPIHLSGHGENRLIKIFRDYKKGDWVFSTHRSHYHWLLSGHCPKELKRQIINGHSMHIYGDKFFTSAIVGGNAPIALGAALALKRKRSTNRVWCFIGDMSSECGIAHECIKYARGHDLPITFVIEDNSYSVRARTSQTWGVNKRKVTRRYAYKRRYPHAGTGKYVMF